VFARAHASLKLSPSMESVKNAYENRLLQAFSQDRFDEEKVQELVNEYTQIRMKDCMLKTDFAE
jgi:hypothetical protein